LISTVNRDGCTRFCYSIIFVSLIEYFLFWVKQNVRAKGHVVNSVFLVQLSKMMVTDPGGSTRIKELPEDTLLNRVCGGDSSFGRASGNGSVGVARRIVHRGRTGNAERQWPVAGGQWPVLAAGAAENQESRRWAKLFWGGADGAAVIGVPNFPQDHVGVAVLNAMGVA
jgi:hypothetical protein